VDILARILATGLTEHYKQAAIVDNRPGASGNIGIDMVKRAKPDGHTLLVVPQGNLTINPTLMPKLPYNVFGDFVPVASMGRTANVIAVNPQVPAKSVQELVALSKAKPNSISYARPAWAPACIWPASCSRTSRAPTSCMWPTKARPRA
jgi:tripartite-type tricarboxylate transporter receptor subunit TctC